MPAQVVRTLTSPPVTIGAHSLSHPRLSRLPRDEARKEIAGSKAVLEELIGRQVTLFAFPYGDFDAETTRMCEEAGYAHAFSIIPELVDPSRRAFLTGRVSVAPDDGRLEFFLKSQGAYAWVRTYTAIKQRLMRRQATPSQASNVAPDVRHVAYADGAAIHTCVDANRRAAAPFKRAIRRETSSGV
jgi:peptidoglycan/xylan/chitin deacetylase (PgdA/CDA1 family)